MSQTNPLFPANGTHSQNLPDTGSLETVGASRREGNLPTQPPAQSTAPENASSGKPEVASSLDQIKAAGDALARDASPAGAV